MTKQYKASVSNTECNIRLLKADKAYAVEYFKLALEELDDPNCSSAQLKSAKPAFNGFFGLN